MGSFTISQGYNYESVYTEALGSICVLAWSARYLVF